MIDDPEVVTVEVPPDPDVVQVEVEAAVQVIEVLIPGEQGPAGKQGPPGTGGGITHVQATPAASWPITHGLGRRPLVAVFDAGGAEMIADVLADDSTATVIFSQPTAGSAILI